MELTLKRMLENAEFKKYRKGYDPVEVDDFLDKAVAMAAKVEVQLTQTMEKAKAGGGGPSAAEIEAEVERQVAERLAAQPASGPSEEDSAEQVRRTIVMAQRTADAAIAEAREDAEKIVSAAREQADTLTGDAQANAEAQRAETESYVTSSRTALEEELTSERREARQRLAAEIAELEGTRESLRADVNILERHVEEQRSQLGSTLAELQQILDDPSGFRMAPVPALADPQLPDFSDLAEPPAAPAQEEAPEPEPDAVAAAPATPDADADAPADEPAAAAEPEQPAAEAAVEAEPSSDAPEPERSEPPAAPTLTFEEFDHPAPGLAADDSSLDTGPPTAPVAAVDLGASEGGDEDAFLAELRKAMADDEPLGPRDQEAPSGPDPFFEDGDRRGWRFGRKN